MVLLSVSLDRTRLTFQVPKVRIRTQDEPDTYMVLLSLSQDRTRSTFQRYLHGVIVCVPGQDPVDLPGTKGQHAHPGRTNSITKISGTKMK